MRSVNLLITLAIFAAPAWIDAQGTPLGTGAPEVFLATAEVKNATGAISGSLEARVSRYTPDFDRKQVEEALRLGGYPRFVTALRNAPEAGQLKLGANTFTIRYAREKVERGSRTILLVTDRPAFFIGATAQGARPQAGFEVSLLEIQMDGTGRGTGRMIPAARVRPDGDGGVLLDSYADQPITLAEVSRKPL